MKINDLNEAITGFATRAEKGAARGAEKSGERGLAGLSREEQMAAAKAKRDARRTELPKVDAKNAPKKGNELGAVPERPKKTSKEKPAEPATNLGRKEPSMDAPTDAGKAPAAAPAASDALPPRGRFQSKKDYVASLTPKQQKAFLRAQEVEKALPNTALDTVKANKGKTALGLAALGGAAAITANSWQKGKEADAAVDAAAAPAAPVGPVNSPANSPTGVAVPADNDTRQNKPYPAGSPYADAGNAASDNDTRQSKPYPEVARPADRAATSTGYKGSAGSQAIQALNPEITDVNKIRTGQQIKLPSGETYTVQKGDALDRIARNAGLTPKPAAVTPEKPAAVAPVAEPAVVAPVAEPAPSKVYTGEPASVDTRDGTGDNDKPAAPTRDYSSGRPVDKELDDKYGTSNTRTDAEGRTYVRQKSAMGGPDTENRSYASFGDFFNKIRGKGDVNGKVADEVQESSELNIIKKLSSVTESKITQVDNNMDLKQLLAIMSETKMADLKGKKHSGGYGKEYDTDSEDDEGTTEKKTRGGQEKESTKDAKKWQGADDAADAIIGGKAPKKEVGKKSVKHSIKEWMQVAEEMLAERAKNKYAVGMAAAKKQAGYGSKPAHDLPKKVVKKGHEIAKKIDEQDVSEELKGGQKKIDKNKNGKLDSEDFKMLRKSKVDEGVNLHKMMTEKQTKVDEMLEELQQEIAEFKATGEMGDKLRDALDLHTYTKGETLIGEETDSIGDEIRHGQDVQRDKDMASSDARHMQDMDRSRDDSTADLWRMKDLARDQSMGRADAISLREDDHKEGDTVYHRGQIGIVDRIEGNKCFVHKPNGDMDVWPTHECSKKKQGAFDMFKKDVQDVGAGFGRFLKGKSELDESPFAFEDASKHRNPDWDRESKQQRDIDYPSGSMKRHVPDADEISHHKEHKAKKSRELAGVMKHMWGEEAEPKLKTTMTDTGSETTSSTGRIKATFEPGKETKVEPVKESFIYDVWNHQLEKMINESIINESLTVTTTKGDNGTDDSVSVTASGNDATDIMAILRNAGIGSMGNEEEHIDHPTSAYGAPEGESVGVVQIDGPKVIDGDDTMLGLMKKIANINDGHEEGHEEHMGHDSSEDYADENSGCEEEVEEGNAFTGALKDTPQGGEFEVDGKQYTDTSSLEEAEVEEGNKFTGNLAKARAAGEEYADLDGDGDKEKVEEGYGTCNECGMNEGECEHTKMVEGTDIESAEVGLEEDAEYANSDDDAALQDIQFMTNYITGGINGQKTMHRHGYQNGDNPLAMRESVDPIAQWKKLSGLS